MLVETYFYGYFFEKNNSDIKGTKILDQSLFLEVFLSKLRSITYDMRVYDRK